MSAAGRRPNASTLSDAPRTKKSAEGEAEFDDGARSSTHGRRLRQQLRLLHSPEGTTHTELRLLEEPRQILLDLAVCFFTSFFLARHYLQAKAAGVVLRLSRESR